MEKPNNINTLLLLLEIDSMSMELFKNLGIPVDLKDEDSFLKVKETLTRIGVASKKEKVLYQSVHLLHKQGYYHILHFKELFMLDGRPSDLSENDISRRNAIAFLLEDWELLKVKGRDKFENNLADLRQIKILTYKEKSDWELCAKYQIGSKKHINRI